MMRPMDLLALAEEFTFKQDRANQFRRRYQKIRQALDVRKSVMLAISDLGLTAQFKTYVDRQSERK